MRYHAKVRHPVRRGYSLVGLLITFACIAVLFSIYMTAVNKAVTGEGSAVEGTVRSYQDQITLTGLYQILIVHAGDYDNRYLTPSHFTGDRRDDTTANFFSAMVMNNQVKPEQLIAGNEYSSYVWEAEDYDYTAFSPRDGVYWDPAFEADLDSLSNTSFAHVPFFGERFDRNWQPRFTGSFPLLGNRGPKDGVDDPESWTYGRNAQWGGHIVLADGSVDFIETFTPSKVVYERDGTTLPDNVFAIEDGPEGRDAILSFTKTLGPEGPELQWD